MSGLQQFILGLVSYAVVLVGVVGGFFYGRNALRTKDDQIETLKLFQPERVAETFRKLHEFYRLGEQRDKERISDLEEKLTVATADRDGLEAELERARARLPLWEFGLASTTSPPVSTTINFDPAIIDLIIKRTGEPPTFVEFKSGPRRGVKDEKDDEAPDTSDEDDRAP